MSIFFLAIMEKSSKEKYRFTTANLAASQNQRLTETLLFIFAISVLSWLPIVVVH